MSVQIFMNGILAFIVRLADGDWKTTINGEVSILDGADLSVEDVFSCVVDTIKEMTGK